jgi:hypothetical protein
MPAANAPRTLTPDNRQFTFAASAALTPGTTPGSQRKFAGVAYSGEVISGHWYWGNVIFDVSSLELPTNKLAMLVDHDSGKRAGFADSFSLDGYKLKVSGSLLSNDAGSSVAKESDEGFPWQMSVHINPGSIEEVQAGQPVIVNGQALTGPLTVFRNSTLSEVSFTAVGWDENTSAAAMSRGSGSHPTPSIKEDNSMDLATAQARIAELEAAQSTLQASNTSITQERDAALAAAAKFSADARVTEIQNLFGVLKKEFKADDPQVLVFSAMSAEQFAATASILKSNVATMNPALFSNTAVNGAAGGTNAGAGVVENPLLADAKARNVNFSAGTTKRM